MTKRYDQRSTLCPECHFFWKAGIRHTSVGDVFYPDGCMRYAYSFHDCYEVYDGCDGFATTEQHEQYEKQRQLLKRKRK